MPERPPATVARMPAQTGHAQTGHAQTGHAQTGRGLAPAWLAIAVGALVTVLTIAGLVAIALAHQSEGQLIRLLNVLFAAPLGTLVASRRPANPFGWLMLGAGLFLSVSDGAAAYTVLDYRLHGGRLPLWQLTPLGLLGLLACWTAWLAVQVPRYRRSGGERRLQLKWLYSGGAASRSRWLSAS
jgi:hypothetical protein